MAKGNFKQKLYRFFIKVLIVFLIITVIPVIVYRFVPPPITPLMIIRYYQNQNNGNEAKIEKQWISFERISSNTTLAAISAEDQRFTEHFGFDFDAISKAYEHNTSGYSGKVVGGSTISQQVAKNVFLVPNRSFIRKGFEAYFTVLIEVFWSKKRIMEVYLNVIEMGDGIYGIEAASQKYFNKPARELTKSESAAIMAIVPNPRKFSVLNPAPNTLRYKNAIIRHMREVSNRKLYRH
ncbi:MAG: monofunctional biosynthetic peptidoglycan transglycosylase [Bacteroidota bacterium]|nr:monofunctional biosynthetic peptidoglycan transglycosylase [Bacteroidota bacterium]